MDVWDFNLRHLKALAITVRLGSINATAKTICLSQPAVTQAINGLEERLEEKLFERGPDGMAPYKAAEIFAVRIEKAISYIGSGRVTSTQARAFLAMARTASYVGASSTTGLSQPSLHRSVRSLEMALGYKLTKRRGRGLALTQRGRRTARAFRLAKLELEAGLVEVAALQGRDVGQLSIGAMPLSRARILPAAVVLFQRQHSDVDVSVVEGSHHELIEPLRDGELDFLIGALRDPSPGPDVAQEVLFVDWPVILARRGHPLGKKRLSEADPKLLAKYPWIVPETGVPLRELWARIFTSSGLPLPRIPIVSGSVILIRQLLMETDCLTILSPDQVAVELEAGWLIPICKAPSWLSRTIGITTRIDWHPTELQRDMLDNLRECANNREPQKYLPKL